MAPSNDFYGTSLAAINSADVLCEIARPLIRAKARRFVGRVGFTAIDQDDLEQECCLRLVERFAAARDNSTIPVIAFIKRVVNQSVANQIRDRHAHKRDSRRTKSLDSMNSCDIGQSVAIPADSLSNGVGPLFEMAIDVEAVLNNLEHEQRELCQFLGIESVSELARRFRRPRSTVQGKVNAIRETLEQHGIDENFSARE